MIGRYGFGTGRAARRRAGAAPAGSGPSLASLAAVLFASGAPGAAWDFSDPAALFQDAAGAVPVTAPGQPVMRALDISGNGRHLVQASASAAPLWTTLPTNGKPAAFFDGVDDFLSLASLDLTATDKVTVFAGLRKMADTNAIIAETSASSSSNPGAWRVSVNGNAENLFFLAGGTSSTSLVRSGLASPFSAVLAGQSSIAAPLLGMRVNGMEAASTVSQGTGTFGNHPLYIGRRAGTQLPWNGYLTSLVVLGRLATAEEIAAFEAAVNAQIGAW